jgi:Zn-dependent protease
MSLLWTLFCYLVAFFGLSYGLLVYRLTNARVNYMDGSVVDDDTVPLYLRDLYKLATVELEGLGFKDCGYLEHTPFFQEISTLYHPQVFIDGTNQHFALVNLRYPVNARDPFVITFYTWFEGDYLSITYDRQAHGVIQPMLDATINDYRLRDLEQQWNYHCQQSAKIDRQISILDIHGFRDRFFSHFRKYLDDLAAKKLAIYVEESKDYRLAMTTIYRLAYSIIFKKPKAQPLSRPIDLPSEISAVNSQILDRLQKNTTKPHRKFWWFALSAIAFYITTLPYMGWQFGIQLSLIILFHELGHLVGMKLCGYRNTQMLFVPFLGGLATGKNDEATLWQKFWVVMLGPLPGIILGLIMLFTSNVSSPWYWGHSFGLWTIGINLLNLLPIYPLDGGRIVGLLLQPYPYVGIIFKIICAFISILVGLTGGIIFLFFGIAIAVSIPLDLQTARAIEMMKSTPGDSKTGKEEWVKWALELLGNSSQLPAKAIDRKNFMNNLWEWRLGLDDRTLLRWGLGLIYITTFIGSIATSGHRLFNRNSPLVSNNVHDDLKVKGMTKAERQAYYQQALKENDRQIASEPNNVIAYRKRLSLHRLLKDDSGQVADLDRLIILEPKKPDYLYQRLRAKQRLRQFDSIVLDAHRLLETHPHFKSKTYQILGEIYTQMERSDLAIASYTAHLKTAYITEYSVYIERSKLYDKTGDLQLALADLNMAISVYPKYAEAYRERAKVRDRLGDKNGANSDRQMANKIEAESAKEEGEE